MSSALLRRWSAVLFLMILRLPAVSGQGLPQDHDYQKRLRAYLATLKEEDFALPNLPPKELPKTVSTELAYRAWILTSGGGYGAPRFGELRVPASQFTLASIESDKGVLFPAVTPSSCSSLAAWDYPFNPYHGNAALKRRAFVVSAIDLMMHDRLHEANPKGPANRSDFLGGTLIWLGYDYGVCKDVIPAEARAAYETGLKKLVKRLDEWGPKRAMTDMDLFAMVGLHFCARATGDRDIKAISESYSRNMLKDRRLYHPAGYFVDCGVFDASYNGISLYFTSWAATTTRSPLMRDALASSYRLRSHLSLPEPDGTLLGPTHFNPRTSGDAPNDQWNWRFRDCAAAMLTDEALACARPPTAQELASAPASLLSEFSRAHVGPVPTTKPTPWTERHWTMYPVFAEVDYQAGFVERLRKLEAEKSPLLVLPFRRSENFVRAFDDQFVIAKRPNFGAVIYTGPVGNMHDRLRRPLGFGGGALSAFWTPATGSVILGRRRGIQGPNWDRLEEWPTWPTHAVSALTDEGKLTTSARIQTPVVKSKMESDTADVTVSGAMPTTNIDQGQVLKGKVDYERRFELSDAGLKVRTTLRSDRTDRFRSVHEILPVFLYNAAKAPKPDLVRILYRDGESWKPVPADKPVKTVKLRVIRYTGAIDIELDRARAVKLSANDWTDGYMSSATCRNVLIDLLEADKASPFETLEISYRLVAGVTP